MAYVHPLERDHADESIRPVYDQVTQQVGHMLNLFKVLAHNPAMLQGFLGLNSSLSTVELDPKLRELAYLKASQINHCGYCTHYHTIFGTQAGLTAEQIAGLASYTGNPIYDSKQQAVLSYTEEVTKHCRADRAIVARLKEFLSDRQLMELTVTISLANFTNRMNDALAIELP